MIVAYCGNVSENHVKDTPGFSPSHSTENHVKQALRNLGHEVRPILELGLDWSHIPSLVEGADLFLWTRTAGFDPADLEHQARIIKGLGIPTVGFHLDRWIGLHREPDVHRTPFFRLDHVFTADGGHDDFWVEHGINHHWSPPAILSSECEVGNWRKDLAADVGFVGNLRNYGHEEWRAYRLRLYQFLARRYKGAFRLWQGGMRGRDLADLYQSVKVLVGDSCLAGGATKYWSDRVPETLGRGGWLIHPYVHGLDLAYPMLPMYPLGDLGALGQMIDVALAHDDERREVAARGREHVLAHHTYEHRLARVLEIVAG